MDAQPSQELRRLIQKVSGGAALSEVDPHRARTDDRGCRHARANGRFPDGAQGARRDGGGDHGRRTDDACPRVKRVEVPPGAVDIVGTGGDGTGTFNVSTCAALIAAGAGIIAKHGNRSVSSLAGASDVLSALGVKLDVPFEIITRCVEEAGVGFMWAPQHHPAMRHWAPIRGELGIRTIFNLLGPISNPAGVKRQVVGVFSWQWVEPIAHVLKNLGAEHVWVVHGHDGLDELTTTGATDVAECKDGTVTVFEVTPADAGLAPAKLSNLKGGDAKFNAAAIREVLSGKKMPLRDIAVLNAAAALMVADKAANLTDGAALAAHSIKDSGAGRIALERLVAITNGQG